MKRIAIVCDGRRWYVRRIRTIELDATRDEMVYHCDKSLGNDFASLSDVPVIKKLINRRCSNFVSALRTESPRG